jgi:hypothetical protein
MSIEDCLNLVDEGIKLEYPNPAEETVIGEDPVKLLNWSDVSLWAQIAEGGDPVTIRMRSTLVMNFLRGLAAEGFGVKKVSRGVLYMFVKSTLLFHTLDDMCV